MRIQAIQNSIISKSKFSLFKGKFNYSTAPNKDIFELSQSAKNKKTVYLDIDESVGNKLVKSLATSTSGHRAPYDSDVFDKNAVTLITLGVADYAKKNSLINGKPTVIIGGDTRRATRESLPLVRDTLLKQGVDVIYIKDPVPTPLLAMSAKMFEVGTSVLMTASHNPWTDGGFNFITSDGAIAPAEVTGEIAKNIDEVVRQGYYVEEKKPTGVSYEFDPYKLYKSELESTGLIDFEKIKNSGVNVYYDGLNGTGKYVMPRLLRDYSIPCDEIISSGQIGPNPTAENLSELSKWIENGHEKLRIGLANDGDADRFGIIDENGDFIDPNDVLLMVAYHLIKNKGLKGDIVRSQATSQLVERIGKNNNLKTHETPVGFKYLASDILNARKEGRDIIIAGEESGGLAAYGCIPEKDGILADFIVLDLIATEKKPISEIIKNIKKDLGYVTYVDNYSKRLKDEETKCLVMEKVEKRFDEAINGDVDFGRKHQVDIEKTLQTKENILKYRPIGDGFKFVMTDGSTVLVRKSGTEPLTRFYIEAVGQTEKEARNGAISLKEYIEDNFNV